MFEGPKTFVIGNDSVKRCYIHGENKFVLVEETKVTKNFKCVLAVLNVRRYECYFSKIDFINFNLC